jgi:hypothetical protein
MRWKDISEWQPGERRDSRNRLSIEGPALRIVIYFRGGAWWLHVGELGYVDGYIGVMSEHLAKQEAICLVQTKLERMLSDLHAMKGAS